MVKLTFKEQPLSGKIKVNENEIYPIFDVTNGRMVIDHLFEEKKISEGEWKALQIKLLQSNLPNDILETKYFKEYKGSSMFDVMGEIIINFIVNDIDEIMLICENEPDEVLQPEFRQCTKCNLCGMIFLPNGTASKKLSSKSEAYALISSMYFNEKLTEYASELLVEQVSEATIPEETRSKEA